MKKIICIIGLALFVGAVAFNYQMNANQNQTNNVTLENIEVLTALASENPCDSCDGNCCKGWFCHACCESGESANCTLMGCQCI